MYFNSNIKILRQRRKLTQDMVAIELGISRSTINSYENGSVQNPTLEALVSFSKFFKIFLMNFGRSFHFLMILATERTVGVECSS